MGTEAPQPFQVLERSQSEHSIEVVLLGELDMAGTDELALRVRAVARPGRVIRLNLSQLGFIDVCGLRAVIDGVEASRRGGIDVVVERDTSRSVARLIDLTGTAPRLWPIRSRDAPRGAPVHGRPTSRRIARLAAPRRVARPRHKTSVR